MEHKENHNTINSIVCDVIHSYFKEVYEKSQEKQKQYIDYFSKTIAPFVGTIKCINHPYLMTNDKKSNIEYDKIINPVLCYIQNLLEDWLLTNIKYATSKNCTQINIYRYIYLYTQQIYALNIMCKNHYLASNYFNDYNKPIIDLYKATTFIKN